MSGPVPGLTRKFWLKAETSYDTYIAIAATDAIDVIEGILEPEIEYEEMESHVGTASLQGHIEGNEANKWSLESYIMPGAVGVAPDLGPLLTHAIGAETIVGGTSVTYEPIDTNPTAGLSILIVAGAANEYYERANGAWCESLTIEANQGEAPKISASGGYGLHSMAKQGANGTAIEPGGESVIALDTKEAGCFVGEPLVKFDTEDNGGSGYQVTAVDHSADTITITPVLAGGTEVGDLVHPVVVSQTLTGTPINGVQNTVTIGGTSVGLIKATVTIATGLIGLRDGTSQRPIRLMRPTKRRITGEIEIFELVENTLETGQAWNNATAAINLQFGPATAAARFKIEMPACKLKVVKPAWSDEDGLRMTLAFTAEQSAAAKDEIDLIFD